MLESVVVLEPRHSIHHPDVVLYSRGRGVKVGARISRGLPLTGRLVAPTRDQA